MRRNHRIAPFVSAGNSCANLDAAGAKWSRRPRRPYGVRLSAVKQA